MDKRRVKLVVGSLLHDVGKLLYRYNDGRNHSVSGYEYLKNELKINDCEILDQVLYHHAVRLRNACLPSDSFAYITYIADNIASAADRRERDAMEPGFDRAMPLQSIFNLLNENDEKYVYQAAQLEADINYPAEKGKGFDEAFYGKIVNHLSESLHAITYTDAYVNSLLEILEADLSYIPSSTMKSEVADISLYDHVKLTAALALCIDLWLEARGVDDYREELFVNASDFYDRSAFLLFSMDMSGIQDFIYTIASKDALKSLRSRSFYLELLMENFIDELVNELDVTRANLIYSGGGHAYLLLPNTETVKARLEAFERSCNQWLLEQFHTALFLGCGYCACSASELHNQPEGSYRNIFKQVSAAISEKKVHRYLPEQMIWLNQGDGENRLRECRVCRTSDRLTDEDICTTCDALIKMSGNILYRGFYAVTTRADVKPSLPLPYGKFLIAQKERDLLKNMKMDELQRVYTKNVAYTGWNVAKRLWVGDYTNGESLGELAEGAEGIHRLAVLRADVDDLGNAFVNGFSSKKYKERYMTISRTAAFSRKMSMFFKYHINSILENGHCYIGDRQEKGKRRITVVYSGGDDIFIVGSWDEIIGFAVDLQESFARFSQGTLSISAGIGIYPGKYPISAMAGQTGELEECAKRHPGKNAVALFEPDLTFGWQEFRTEILDVKLAFLKQFFAYVPEKGKAFLYRILELIQNMEEDKINLARLAYFLARLEESVKGRNHAAHGLDIQGLSHQIYEWIRVEKDRNQFVAAIYLYVYLIREGES